MVRFLFYFVIALAFNVPVYSQNVYSDKEFQFLSYEKIPTWPGVATGWNEDLPAIHLYDYNKYKGHAQYISVCLKTGITFKQFKEQVRNPYTRKYIPFFLYDLRDTNVIIDGSKYTWAVRIEDYRYEDNRQQMAETILKLLNTVSTYIGKQSGIYSKGIIVLASDPNATPNTSVAETINKNGYPDLTLSQLLTKAGGKKAEVLNSGTGIGYLKYVPAGQETSIQPSVKDILVYENLPEQVPPISGIITLEPQTPLSHINLLARNRGTINLYATDLKYIPGAKQLMNKLVKITCSGNRISITEAGEKEAKEFWESRIRKIDIPRPFNTANNIVDLNKSNPVIQSTPYVGAKASNYAILRQLFPTYVKQGYAIPFSWYFNTIKSCGADTLIRALITQKPGTDKRNKQLEQIRERILNAGVSPTLIGDIKNLIQEQFACSKIRLRSSTNCEDLPGFNGAGLYTSEGYSIDDGDVTLAGKILRVYASLWSLLAFEEREFYFINHSNAGMAILINEAFSNEYANGVAVTIPEQNNLSLIINTQSGENSVTNPENGQIPESVLFASAQDNTFEIKSRSGIHDIFLREDLKNQLNELKKVVLDIHKSLTANLDKNEKSEYGVDVEFKLMAENGELKLYIKQARLLRTILPE